MKAGPALHDGISLTELQSVLSASGMQSDTQQTGDGTPYLYALIPNTQVHIALFGIACPNAKCQGFAINAWNTSQVTVQFINEFNDDCCYVRASMGSDGRPRLIGEYVALGGIGDQNILLDVSSFVDGMVRFSRKQGSGQSADLGAPTAKAPAGIFAEASKAFSAKGQPFAAKPLTAADQKLIDEAARRPSTD
jgi:hypothetical protein